MQLAIHSTRAHPLTHEPNFMTVFSIDLFLVSAAEINHKLRSMKETELNNPNEEHIGPLPIIEESMKWIVEEILDNKEGTKEEMYDYLMNQKVEIVLTTHPTEGKTRVLIWISICRNMKEEFDCWVTLITCITQSYYNILTILPAPTTVNRKTILRNSGQFLKTWVNWMSKVEFPRWNVILWQLRDQIKFVQSYQYDKVKLYSFNVVIETVLWEAVPSYLRKLDPQCMVSLGKRLPIDFVPIKFASWIGGDCGGNPNVTPEVMQ